MNGNLDISNYLTAVFEDWQRSRDLFPENVYLTNYWPIPFFGNPAAARVATVGVNPSSGEFRCGRGWDAVQNSAAWKRRLRDYFAQPTPPHKWFEPWRVGLATLGLSYERGTAAHFDVSYRPTKAMLKNNTTNPEEFRRMVEKDVAWLFRLLPLCLRLRGLLVFGPIIRSDGRCERLTEFLKNRAPQNGFTVSQGGGLRDRKTGREFFVHEADTPEEKSVTSRVVKNLNAHRGELRRRLGAA